MNFKFTASASGSVSNPSLSIDDGETKENFNKTLSSKKYFRKLNKNIEAYQNWTARTIVTHTKTHCCINWCVIFFLTFIVIAGNFIAIHELQFNDFMLLGVKDVQNFFAFDDAQTQVSENSNEEILFRSEPSFFLGILTLYEVEENEKLLTPENLKLICQVEKIFLDEPDYPLFCHTAGPNLGLNTDCLPQEFSLANAFYQNNLTSCDEPILLQEDIDAVFAFFQADPVNNGGLQFFNNLENPTVGRSNLKIGTPLGEDSPPFKNFTTPVSDFLDEEALEGHEILQVSYSESIFNFFNIEHDPPLINGFNRKFFQKEDNELQVRIYSFLIDQDHLNVLLTFDQIFVVFSFLFVLIYVWIYVKSFFLAFVALTSISFSMVIGLFLYAAILQINYFTTIHVISFFIILAVGANNFYVMVDAWRQSKEIILKDLKTEKSDLDVEFIENEEYLVLIRRMKYSFSRAALSVFNTSMTTFIAFVANLVSPIAAIAGFGLFSGIVVFVNFLFMLNVHPTHVMMYEKYVRHIPTPWSKIKGLLVQKQQEAEGNEEEGDETKITEDEKETKGKEKEKEKWYIRGRSGYIFLMNNTPFPYISLVCTLILAGSLISVALQLETPTTVETLYPSSHMFSGFIEDFNGDFTEGSDDTFTLVHGVFGIEGLDRNGVKFLDANQFRGTAIFDENFNFYSQTTQDYIIRYCEEISQQECLAEGCTIDTLILPDTLECTMLAFRNFFERQTGSRDSFSVTSNGTETGFSEDQVFVLLNDFVEQEQSFSDKVGLIENEVKFIAISFRQSMKIDQPLVIKEPVIDVFDEVSSRVIEQAPEEGLDTFFQTSFDLVWQHTERGLVSGLFIGMAVSLGASYVIVLFGTRNILVSIFAISGVFAIVGCVLGSAQSLDFALGTTEAIAGVMVIGLAVDYIVHLGYMFIRGQTVLAEGTEIEGGYIIKTKIEKEKVTNAQLIEFAVEKMMFTILAGGLTTFSAALVLFACTLSFFLKMATLIMFTSLYSVIFAFLYFVPLLRIFGPGKKR